MEKIPSSFLTSLLGIFLCLTTLLPAQHFTSPPKELMPTTPGFVVPEPILEDRTIHFSVQSLDTTPLDSSKFKYSLGPLISPDIYFTSITGSPRSLENIIDFSLPIPKGILPDLNQLGIYYKGKKISEKRFFIPHPLPNAGEQPLIVSVDPPGGFFGKEITVTGKNFGDELDNIYVWFMDREGVPLPAGINPIHVNYLTSQDPAGNQEIRFWLPELESLVEREIHGHKPGVLSTELKLFVFKGGQPSGNVASFKAVKENYRGRILILIFGVSVVFVGLIYLVYSLRKRQLSKKPGAQVKPFHSFLIDEDTNRLSLSKVQIFIWTLILVFGYSYYALAYYLLLDHTTIPDFDSSLLILLGISAGGSLVAGFSDKTNATRGLPKVDRPRLLDLISTPEGGVSITQLQLVAFTVVAIGLYLTYLSAPDLVIHGMPSLPNNLLILMGISQGGFVTGKAIESGGGVANTHPTPTQQADTKGSREVQEPDLEKKINRID